MRTMRLAAVVVGLACTGCSAAFWQGVAQGMAAMPTASPAPATMEGGGSGVTTAKLMIFGGQGHKTYLGCLNCSQYANDSVFNEFGPHGSAYQTESIFNKYGDYGSPYSSFSACNPYATDPPVIVDGAGEFYGRLTVNTNHPQATHSERYLGWIAGVCRR